MRGGMGKKVSGQMHGGLLLVSLIRHLAEVHFSAMD